MTRALVAFALILAACQSGPPSPDDSADDGIVVGEDPEADSVEVYIQLPCTDEYGDPEVSHSLRAYIEGNDEHFVDDELCPDADHWIRLSVLIDVPGDYDVQIDNGIVCMMTLTEEMLAMHASIKSCVPMEVDPT